MSKLLKRTFAFALVFCMLLSVIPAVSAAYPASNATVYNFGAAYNNGTKITEPLNVTKALYEAGSLYEDEASTKPLNWYTLGKSTSEVTLKFENGLFLNNGYSHWAAVVIDVPETKEYDIVAQIYASGNGPRKSMISLIRVETNPEVLNVSGSGTNMFNRFERTVATDIDFFLRNTTGGYAGYAYLGHQTLYEGKYVLAWQKSTADTSNPNQMKITSLTLTPDTTSAFVDAYNANTPSTWGSNRPVYQLAANVNAPDATLQLRYAGIALRGYELKVKEITQYTGSVNGSSNTKYYITDTTGNGSLVVGGEEHLPFATTAGGSTYRYTDANIVFCAEPADRTGAVAGSKSFGFDIGLLADAYGWDLSGAAVKLEIVVAGEETGAVCNYSEDMVAQWVADNAGSDAEAFYVDIAGYEKLAGKTLNFKVTVSSNNAEQTAAFTYTVPAA